MPKKVDEKLFDNLGDMLREEQETLHQESAEPAKPFHPSLGPTQTEIFNCDASFILVSGERGTGKTYGTLHKILRHCWEEQNALAVIVVGVRSQATQGGAWDKLLLQVAPEWREGMGLEVTDPKLDQQQYAYVHVRNRHGGWSKVVLVSSRGSNKWQPALSLSPCICGRAYRHRRPCVFRRHCSADWASTCY